MRNAYALASLIAALGAGCGGGTTNNNPDGGTSACANGLVKFDGVCILPPTIASERTQCGDVTEFCDNTGTKSPSLGCLTAGAKTRPTTPTTVTLTGWVHPFSAGKSNSAISIQVYKESDLTDGKDITTATPIAQSIFTFDPTTASDPTQYRVCDNDPKIGCIAAVDPSKCSPRCADGLPGDPSDQKKYCHDAGGGNYTCNDRLRWERRFAIDGIPTNTPIVIRTSGDMYKSSTNWNTLVQWNVYLATDAASCGGNAQAVECLDTSDPAKAKYQLNVNAISQTDYGNIPVSAGVSGGISPSQGAVAGEVHDCDNIRVDNVQVSVTPQGERLTYFNGNPFDTVPDSSRAGTGTDRLGLFTSINVKPGAVTVRAIGFINGQNTSLGKYTAFTYPGVVSVVNINGGRPVQGQ